MTALKQPKHLFLLSALAGTIILVGGGIQADSMLKSVGVTDIFAAVSLSGDDKVNLALYLTLIASSTATILWAGATTLKGYTRRGRVIAYAALAPGLGALAVPTVLGYPQSILGFTVTVLGLAIICFGSFSMHQGARC